MLEDFVPPTPNSVATALVETVAGAGLLFRTSASALPTVRVRLTDLALPSRVDMAKVQFGIHRRGISNFRRTTERENIDRLLPYKSSSFGYTCSG